MKMFCREKQLERKDTPLASCSTLVPQQVDKCLRDIRVQFCPICKILTNFNYKIFISDVRLEQRFEEPFK